MGLSHMGTPSMYKSAQIVSNCHGLVSTVDDKHQLKADICRYLESVPMNMLTIPDGVELICLIQQEKGAFSKKWNVIEIYFRSIFSDQGIPCIYNFRVVIFLCS